MSNIVNAFKQAFKRAKEKNWDSMYVLIDMHGTIFKPSYLKEETYEYYPYVKEVMRILNDWYYTSKGDMNVVCILWTSTTREAGKEYIERMKEDGIRFDYVNENPEVSRQETDPKSSSFDDKFYFNVGLDDKFGFDPDKDWKKIYDYLITL